MVNRVSILKVKGFFKEELTPLVSKMVSSFFISFKLRVLIKIKDPVFRAKIQGYALSFALVLVICTVKAFATDANTDNSGLNLNTNLWDNITKLIRDTYSKLLIADTSACGVGAGTGAMMVKFARGKEQMIDKGYKTMWSSGIAWGVLNALGGILGYVQPYLSGTLQK